MRGDRETRMGVFPQHQCSSIRSACDINNNNNNNDLIKAVTFNPADAIGLGSEQYLKDLLSSRVNASFRRGGNGSPCTRIFDLPADLPVPRWWP